MAWKGLAAAIQVSVLVMDERSEVSADDPSPFSHVVNLAQADETIMWHCL